MESHMIWGETQVLSCQQKTSVLFPLPFLHFFLSLRLCVLVCFCVLCVSQISTFCGLLQAAIHLVLAFVLTGSLTDLTFTKLPWLSSQQVPGIQLKLFSSVGTTSTCSHARWVVVVVLIWVLRMKLRLSWLTALYWLTYLWSTCSHFGILWTSRTPAVWQQYSK